MMFNRIREFFAKNKTVQVMANLIDPFNANRPLAETFDVRRFAEEGYRRNSLIFACIVMKGTSFSQPELCAYTEGKDGEQELPENHVLSTILGEGLLSGYQKAEILRKGSQTAFMRTWQMHLDVAGNAYAHIERNAQRMPLRVKLLSRPDLVKPVPNSNGEIYQYDYGSEPNVQHVPAADIIHEMANPDPLDPYRGLSPIAVLARMGDLDNYAADYLRAFFLNAGIPALMAKFKQQTEKPIRERFKEQWKERYSGMRGWHDLFVTDSDIEIQEIGSKVRTMDLESIFGETECRICGTMGVHPILVAANIGLLRSTMANYEQARRSLYADTLLPVWTSTADRFTTDLAAEFGDDIVCEFDLDDVPELMRDKVEEKKLALSAWDSGLTTRNEAREAWGLERDEGGDVYKVGVADSFEPAGIVSESTAPSASVHGGARRIGRSERLRLISGHREIHMSRAQADELRQIADQAVPSVKKKS